MQNTIKNLQAKSDNISKLEDKGSRVVVLQLGSHSIKMGFANEKVPFSISPFIAYALHNINHPTNLHMHYEEESCDHELFKSEYRKVE